MDDAKSLSMIKGSCMSYERIKDPLCVFIMKTIGPSLRVAVDGRLVIRGGQEIRHLVAGYPPVNRFCGRICYSLQSLMERGYKPSRALEVKSIDRNTAIIIGG